MPTTTATLSGNVTDLVGDAIPGNRVRVLVESSQPLMEGTVAGGVRVNPVKLASISDTGDLSIPDLPVTSGGAPLYRVIIEAGPVGVDVDRVMTGWFELTTNRTLDWVRVNAGPAPTLVSPTLVADVTALVEQAEAAKDAAEAVGNTNDTIIAGRINDRASATAASLSATIPAISAANFPGVVGDGVNNDTAGLQSAIDFAYALGKALVIPAGTYKLTSTLLVKSGADVGGIRGKTILKQTTPGQAVMASHNYIAGNGGASGQMTIHDMIIDGEPTNTASHGLIFRDYLSQLERLIIVNCGGNGLHMTWLNSSGASYAGASLVDNRITEVDARNCSGYGLFLGEADNNKFTDAYFQDVYVSAGTGAAGNIYCGSSGGWKFKNVHTYGQAVPIAMEVNNLNHTEFDGIYIEGNWTSAGLQLGKLQQATSVDNVTIKCSGAAVGGSAFYPASRSTVVAETVLTVGNLTVVQDIATAVNGIKLDTTTIDVAVSNYRLDGGNKALITRYAGTAAAFVKAVTDARVDTKVRDSTNKKSLRVGAEQLPMGLFSRVGWSGAGAKSVTVPLPELTNFAVVSATLRVVSVRNYNGSVGARYRGDLILTSKAAGDGWYAYLSDVTAPSGFTTVPTVIIDKATKSLTVNFEPTATDGFGVVCVELGYE